MMQRHEDVFGVRISKANSSGTGRFPIPSKPSISASHDHHSSFAGTAVSPNSVVIRRRSIRSPLGSTTGSAARVCVLNGFRLEATTPFSSAHIPEFQWLLGRIMKHYRHSFSSMFRSSSGSKMTSRFGGSFLQNQCPSGLTPRSSGPDCVGPLNFFR